MLWWKGCRDYRFGGDTVWRWIRIINSRLQIISGVASDAVLVCYKFVIYRHREFVVLLLRQNGWLVMLWQFDNVGMVQSNGTYLWAWGNLKVSKKMCSCPPPGPRRSRVLEKCVPLVAWWLPQETKIVNSMPKWSNKTYQNIGNGFHAS